MNAGDETYNVSQGTPVISVIVPAYNAEEFLSECIESVLAQTLGDFELIIVDDESADSTSAITRNYVSADRRVRLLSIQHAGLSGARNAGIKDSLGRYVIFVDADDTLHPYALETMYAAATVSGADITVAPFIAARTHTFAPNDAPVQPAYRTIGSERLVEKTLYQKISNTQCAKLFDRKLFESAGYFKTGIHYEDLEFSYRAYLAAGLIILLDTPPLYFYRQHHGSFMHRWSLSHLDLLEVSDAIESAAGKDYPGLTEAARVRKFCANYNICLMASANGSQEIATRCWKQVRRYRRHVLFNRHVRLKDMIGAWLSFTGRKTCSYISKCTGKY